MRAIGFGGLYPGMVGMSRGRRGGGGSYTTDAASGHPIPQNTSEWSVFIVAKGLSISPPDHIWLFQESTGVIKDQVGSADLTVTGATYGQGVSGWTAKALTTTDGSTNTATSTSTTLPDISTTNQITLAYVNAPSSIPAGNRVLTAIGAGSSTTIQRTLVASSSGDMRVSSGSNGTTVAPELVGNGVQPIWNSRFTGGCAGYWPSAKVAPTLGAVSGKGVTFGYDTEGLAATVGYLYGVGWDGVKAGWSDATVKAVTQALGWTVTGF